MPIRRRAAKVKEHRITPEAVEAFQAGDMKRLHRALGLSVWQVSPLWAEPDEPCPWPEGSGGAMSWPLAVELRAELIATRMRK